MVSDGIHYNVQDDLNRYPDANAIFVVGGRNTGKTYSCLRWFHEDSIPFGFVKRTNDDVHLMCAGNKKIDLSPFKPINRDCDCNIRAKEVEKGIGAFFSCDDDNEPIELVGYILSLHAVKDIKGFDISICDYIVFDEFIAQPWQRIDRKEGEQLLELMKTATRDRELRGKSPTKLICLANAANINNPVFEEFNLVDIVANMQAMDEEYYYDDRRKILIHLIHSSEEFEESEKNSALYLMTEGTQWNDYAFGNSFAYNDFSCVKKQSLKGYRPFIHLKYKRQNYYIYVNEHGEYYMTSSQSNRVLMTYDLNREVEQKQFFIDKGIDIRNACINGRMLFEKYSMYDLILNYKKIFKI